jgi:RNA polymerase sigma factor (sigma-70 family)
MQPRLLKHPARLAGASLLRLQDDARLVALAREGHDPAFAAIVDRYGTQLERYCARLLGPVRAEDAVQQAFVNAHAAMKTSDQELALKPWLYRIAHNAALNILRAAKDENVALDEDRPHATQTTDVVELRERLRETLASIQALPAAQRDALLLREIEGRSHEEIAVALGVTAGGARQHLHRARVSLRAAASAITPYPVLARVLSAAASEGSRSADMVSGAGLGAGAGAMKAAAGLLAAGAIAGGAVTVQHDRATSSRTTPEAAVAPRSTTAPGAAAGPSAALLEVASVGAASHRGRGHGANGAGSRRQGHEGHPSGGRDDDRGSGEDHHGSSGASGTSGELESSHSGSDDGALDTSHHGSDDGLTTTTPTELSGSGSDDGTSSSSSGPGSGETTTTTTDGSGGSNHSGSDDSATTSSTATDD